MKRIYISIISLVLLFGVYYTARSMDENMEDDMDTKPKMTETAVFAGGCFWCTESDFEKVDGVIEVISGYTGGTEADPTYKQVSSGGTGHVEAVKVTYDPSRITYKQLLDVFWKHVDPTDPGGQFVDRGAQYRSVIFYDNQQEKKMAESSKKMLMESGPFDKQIVTEILPLGSFYSAEDYHQDYYKKNPIRYRWYRSGSGRDKFLKMAWKDFDESMRNKSDMTMEAGKKEMVEGMNQKNMGMESMENMKMEKNSDISMEPVSTKEEDMMYMITSDQELRKRLTPMQYDVTRQNGTEPAFNNEYWDNHGQGIYVDIISGEPLFSSTDKYDSGTGWPSFIRPLESKNIIEKKDTSFFMTRTEVRSKHADSHLGHVFTDGPEPTGLRYCINSAALRFVPVSDLEKEGYGEYYGLFKDMDNMKMKK